MKVLICLAFVGCAFASQAYVAQVAPAVEVLPSSQTAYEYSADVHTPEYKTHQSVRSNVADVAVAPVAVAAPAPVQVLTAAAPATVIAAAPTPIIAARAPIFAAAAPYYTTSIAGPTQYIAAPVAQSVFRTLVSAAPANVIAEQPIVYSAPAAVATTTVTKPIVEQIVEENVVATSADSAAVIQPVATTIVQPATAAVTTVAAADKIQYHSQDTLGQAAYGHAEALQSHNAVQDVTGSKAGSFSYVAPDGRLLTTDYVADHDGYRVATNALPSRRRRSIAAYSAPIVPYAYATHAAPLAYAAHATPLAYAAHAAPLAYATHAAPLAYAAPYSYTAVHSAAPVASVYSAPLVATAAAATSASSTSSLINHGDGLSSTHTFQLN